MKHLSLSLPLLLATTLVAQVEIAPRTDAQKAALQLNNALGNPGDVPFKLETDILNAFAIRAGELAILAVPVHSLKQKIESAKDGDTIPAGQLWLHKIVPDVDGNPASRESLRMVAIQSDGESGEVAMLHLVILKDTSKPELVVYGAGKKPLQTLPLQKMAVPQEAPIELDGRKRGEQSAELLIYLADLFEARMVVRRRNSSE